MHFELAQIILDFLRWLVRSTSVSRILVPVSQPKVIHREITLYSSPRAFFGVLYLRWLPLAFWRRAARRGIQFGNSVSKENTSAPARSDFDPDTGVVRV